MEGDWIWRSLEKDAERFLSQHADWMFGGVPGLLLKYGKMFHRVSAPRIRGGWNRKRKSRHRNACLNVSKNPTRFIYCEGYVWPVNSGLGIHHAWFADRASRNAAIDTTLDDGEFTYVGIALKFGYVVKMMGTTGQFVLNDAGLVKGER